MTPGTTHDDRQSRRQHNDKHSRRQNNDTRSRQRSDDTRSRRQNSDAHASPPTNPSDTGRFAVLAVLPAAATLAGVALGGVVGFGVFDTRTPGAGRAAAYALLVPYFLLCVAGTRWLYEDATRLDASGADWRPDPWHYVAGGGAVLELYYLVPVVNGGGPATGVVAYLAGGFVLSLALSSVVAGPVYVLRRQRNLDDFRLRDTLPAATAWFTASPDSRQ